MEMDYQGNSRRAREAEEKKEEAKVESSGKVIEKIIVGEVVVQKRTMGRRFRDFITAIDAPGVTRYVIYEVMIPAAKHMFVEAVDRGAERIAFGERAVRRQRYGPNVGPSYTYPYTNYATPVTRNNVRDIRDARSYPVDPRDRRYDARNKNTIILVSREDADAVVEQMYDVLETYDSVSVSDLYAMIGREASYVDREWGWVQLSGVQIVQVRDGWLIDLPAPVHLPRQQETR